MHGVTLAQYGHSNWRTGIKMWYSWIYWWTPSIWFSITISAILMSRFTANTPLFSVFITEKLISISSPALPMYCSVDVNLLMWCYFVCRLLPNVYSHKLFSVTRNENVRHGIELKRYAKWQAFISSLPHRIPFDGNFRIYEMRQNVLEFYYKHSATEMQLILLTM